MNVFTAEQMQRVDRTTIEQGTPGLTLMKNAGREVFRFVEELLDTPAKVVVIAGKGNNGGDGFRIAELCAKSGYDPDVILIGDKAKVKGDAAECLKACERVVREIFEVNESGTLDEVYEIILSADIIVDALFGTGLTGAVTGLAGEIIDFVNYSEATILSVDIPSGVNATTGVVKGPSVIADLTVTFGALKVGHVVMPGREYSGEVHVVDIGFPEPIVSSVAPYGRALVMDEAAEMLPKRHYDAHKNSVGRVFVIGGSVGMTGAVALTSSASLHAGAGVVIAGIPSSLNDILEVKLTEVMTLPLAEVRKKRCLSLRALGMIREKTKQADVVAIGPGLGSYFETSELIRRFLGTYRGRVVLDADGINAFDGYLDDLRAASCDMILTPHYGELSRLIGVPTRDIAGDPESAAIQAAKMTGKHVLLKGSPTIICNPAGTIWINGTGNEGMATAGMGDVLTGIIAGLAAQGAGLFEAGVLGAFVHGMAGDYAMDDRGIYGMTAVDVLDNLPDVLNDISLIS